jgi:hypothetical protein
VKNLCTLGLGGSTSVFIFTPVSFFTSIKACEDPTSFFTALPKNNASVIDKGIKYCINIKKNGD